MEKIENQLATIDEESKDKTIDKYLTFERNEMIKGTVLLGTFDKDNKYILSKEIKEDLITAQKFVRETQEDCIYVSLPLEMITLSLKLVLDQEDEQSTADLFLVEYLDDEEIESYIASYEDDSSNSFVSEAKEAFNIFDEEESIVKEGVDSILSKIKANKFSSNDRDFIIEMYSELYLLRMLEILKQQGNWGEEIINEYNKIIQEKKLTALGTKNLYSKLRKNLNKTIEAHGGIKEILSRDNEALRAVSEFIKPIEEFEKFEKEMIHAPAIMDGQPKKEVKKSVSSSSNKKISPKVKSSKPSKSNKKDGGNKKKGKSESKKASKKQGSTPHFVESEPKITPVSKEVVEPIKPNEIDSIIGKTLAFARGEDGTARAQLILGNFAKDDAKRQSQVGIETPTPSKKEERTL